MGKPKSTAALKQVRKIDLFDLENVDDLPPQIKKDILRKIRDAAISLKVMELFNTKDQLTTNEILVGLFRGYNVTRTRVSVAQLIAYMVKKRLIKPISEDYRMGIYKKA